MSNHSLSYNPKTLREDRTAAEWDDVADATRRRILCSAEKNPFGCRKASQRAGLNHRLAEEMRQWKRE